MLCFQVDCAAAGPGLARGARVAGGGGDSALAASAAFTISPPSTSTETPLTLPWFLKTLLFRVFTRENVI